MPGDDVGTNGLIERAIAAEAAGFASAWLPQVATIDALMVLALTGRDTPGAGHDTINKECKSYGEIPLYRATLDRGGAALPADVAVVGDSSAIEAGLLAYADVGGTDFAAVVPPATPNTQATLELLGVVAPAGDYSPAAPNPPPVSRATRDLRGLKVEDPAQVCRDLRCVTTNTVDEARLTPPEER